MMNNTSIARQKRFDRQHAIVIGGSMAGLLAARVLSEHFERVTIIERDHLIDVIEPRKGVPQGRHVHTLLAGGAALLGQYFPDLFAALAQEGAVPVDIADIRRYQFGVRVAPPPGPARSLWQSRPMLERHVRAALLARANVQVLDGCSVTRLITHDERVSGVVVRQHSGREGEEELAASLVVDASGRGSHAPRWLASSGYGQVEETRVTIDVGYATRIYRCPEPRKSDWKVLIVLGTPPDNKRVGVIFPIEGGCWMVTLGGWLRDYPPADEAGFLDFARSLAEPDLYEAIKDAEPLTPIAVYKYSANQWRRYDRLARLPEGFIVMGDAVCAFSPVFGQGMTVAAMEARVLDTCLREQQSFSGDTRATSFPQLFQKAIAREIKTAWVLSTGYDLRYPETDGYRSAGMRLFNWYIRRVIGLTASHPLITAAFFQVWFLLKPLRALFEPRIVWAVLSGELFSRRRRPGIPGFPVVANSPGPTPSLDEGVN